MMQVQEVAQGMHVVIDPAILYFGTPVVLLSTMSAAGAVNLMPMSSAFWLGSTGVLGMGTKSQTYRNLVDTGECVLNLPSAALVSAVNSLALTTGRDPVPPAKAGAGYRYVPDKFGRAGLTPVPADTVRPPRATECPVNLEARVTEIHELEKDETGTEANSVAVEVTVTRVHVHPAIRLPGTANRIDPDAWRPLIMSFQHFYGLGDRLHPSKLATIDEEWYR
jgi:flavin reductase (DIM6/NTAB) family NADH-FMN oxidoreductase RutF